MEERHLKFERLLRKRGFNGSTTISKNGFNVHFAQGSLDFRISFVDLVKHSDKQLSDLADAFMQAVRREEAK